MIHKFNFIVIPTLGRMDSQRTYDLLPPKYQKITRFIVQDHEFDEMNSRYPGKVDRLPKHIDNISETREWIYNNYKDYVYWSFDDDLRFIKKWPTGELNEKGNTQWTSRRFNEQDFDDLFKWASDCIEQGYAFGAAQCATVIPNIIRYPTVDSARTLGNAWWNGPSLPDDLIWNRTPLSEDLDLTLQLLTRGYNNQVNTDLTIHPGTQKTGGCFTYRTLEKHNESNLKLVELWPEFVKRNDKELENGMIQNNVMIYHKRAYQSSQEPKTTKLF